jgi:hypothetical protein
LADPLSTATRATKRNLLIASVLAISANAFNISIDKIPLAGLSVNFDDRLFAFLLVITLAYFLCTFVLYYTIDMKNLETTKHQTEAESSFSKKIGDFEHFFFAQIRRRLNRAIRPEYEMPDGTDLYGAPRTVDFFRSHSYVVTTLAPPDVLGQRQIQGVPRANNEALYASLDKKVDTWVANAPRAWRWFLIKQRSSLYATRAMYFARNYFFDGLLPIALGIFALIAILGHIDLHWIQRFLPSFKVLS